MISELISKKLNTLFNYRKWLKLFFLPVIIFTLIIITTNYFVNPYNIFKPNPHTHFNRLKNYVASDRMTLIYEMWHIRPQTLMVGTSRIGFFNSSLLKPYVPQPIFNLSLAGSSIYEQSQYIEYAIEHLPIKTIIWSLDFFSFNPDKEPYDSFSKQRLQHRYYLNDYSLALFSYATFKQSLKTLKDNTKPYDLNISEYYEQHHYHEVQNEVLKLDQIQRNVNTTLNEYFTIKGFLVSKNFRAPHAIDRKMTEVSKIIALCQQKKIKLIIYTSPVYREHLDMINYMGLSRTYEYWKYSIAQQTDYWDFNTYNSITENILNFRDSSHIRSESGKLIFAKLFKDKRIFLPSDFGTYITTKNILEHIEKQRVRVQPFDSTILKNKKSI